MRFAFLILIALFSSPLLAQTVNKGDNIQSAFKKIKTPYFFPAPSFTSWAEGENMLLIGDQPDPMNCEHVFLALHDTTLIGVYKLKPVPQFLFDTEGNSILSLASDFFILPLWVVKNKTKVVSSDRNILAVFASLYETTMQADDGELDASTLRKYQEYQTNVTLANRHLALLFDNYHRIITQTASQGQTPPAEICVPLMKSLATECQQLFGQVPPIVCVFMGEALQSAGNIDEAQIHFNRSLQIYPESIPLQVYTFRLEKDAAKQKEMLKQLKKNHPQHWMVRDLL